MAHRVSGRIEALEVNGLADVEDVTGADAAAHVWNATTGIFMCNDLCARRIDHSLVATDVIAMLMGIQDLGDLPAPIPGGRKTLPEVQWIDRQRVAGFRARDQIVEIAVGVAGPDLLDDHDLLRFGCVEDEFTADPGLQDPDVIDFRSRYLEVVPVYNDEVGPLSGLEAAQAVFLVRGKGGAERE